MGQEQEQEQEQKQEQKQEREREQGNVSYNEPSYFRHHTRRKYLKQGALNCKELDAHREENVTLGALAVPYHVLE